MAYLGETESVLHSTISAGEYLTVHQLAEVLGNALDTKDVYTHNHSNQVAVISYLIALAMGIEPKAAHLIHIGGHLHDIGKIVSLTPS